MKAIVFTEPGPIDRPGAFVLAERPTPMPGARDLVVRIEAVSVNPVDTKIRSGAVSFGPDTPPVLGFDASGIVVAAGPDVTRFRAGDAVYYAGQFGRPGSNAQFQAVDERLVGHKPATLDHVQAAALPLTAITAWELLFERLCVKFGALAPSADALLVVNGAGGVGSILCQLARRFTGLTVIATASRPETRAWVQRMGAHHVIDHHQRLDQAIAAIGFPEVRYIAGLSASDVHREAMVDALAPYGELALIDDPPSFDIVPFKMKNIAIHWELMATRPLLAPDTMGAHGRILDEVSALVDAGLLVTTLQQNFGPLDARSLAAAHALIESGRSYGKLVLERIA